MSLKGLTNMECDLQIMQKYNEMLILLHSQLETMTKNHPSSLSSVLYKSLWNSSNLQLQASLAETTHLRYELAKAKKDLVEMERERNNFRRLIADSLAKFAE